MSIGHLKGVTILRNFSVQV